MPQGSLKCNKNANPRKFALVNSDIYHKQEYNLMFLETYHKGLYSQKFPETIMCPLSDFDSWLVTLSNIE